MNQPEESRRDRLPYAAGRFYPAGKEALGKELETLFSSVSESEKYPDIRAVISPHAGFVYSGKVAASAFAAIQPGQKFRNIILLGASHRLSFNGASVYSAGDYITPLGRVKVNTSLADRLINSSEYFSFPPEAHYNEHCLEVQLPFIQYCFVHQPEIIPVITGTSEPDIIRSIAESLRPLFTPENLFVVSSDFSHYPSYADAKIVDTETSEAISSGSPAKLLEVLGKYRRSPLPGLKTCLCGWSAVLTLMYLAEGNASLEYTHLMYRNSGDARQGDKDGVVGYHSFAIREKSSSSDKDKILNKQEERELIGIAREAIESALDKGKGKAERPVHDSLSQKAGVFVSIHIGKELRGCIGMVSSDEPLYKSVAKMAYSAAFNDPRFPPISREEFEKATLEISVLTPLHKVNGIDEIIVGTHGLYIRSGGRSGVMLPQVAIERGWNVVQFLEHTAGGKAGIGNDGWKSADIFVFRTHIIHDNI